MTTPRPAAPAPVYSPPPSYAAPQRLPVQRDVSPLSVTGVMITAIVSTILLLFSLKRIFDPPALFSNFFAFLDLIDEGLAETMQWLLYKLLPMDELENMMNIIQLIGELPNIAAVIGMWCIFGAISGRELNRGLFCGSISFIKFFRILSLIAAIVPTILVAFSPLFLGGSDFGDYFTEVFATIYFVCLLSLLFVVAYRSAIVRLLTALQDGARSGHYRGASGFLILCLFVSGIASGISSLLTGVSDMDAVIELLRGSLLPLIYAICLCTYNSRRHSINHS